MTHSALAVKWRPQQFEQVVGQQTVLKTLSNALSLGRIHHAYLFSGTRGVGKTSIARLFVKGLNCEQGITATPCGKCQNCLDIEQGKFVDLIEIDAASRTKVDDTREILDNVQYLPTQGRFKVYLIDEVHMLSKSSFNALLKTLEEPPEYVKFLLATTDPQKIPITILSRCLHLHLQALTQPQIKTQLTAVLTQEKIAYDESALELLARSAHGSLRDGLSLTDQAIALGNGTIAHDLVHEMLGLLGDDLAIQIVEAIQTANGVQLMSALNHAYSVGVNEQALIQEVMQLLHQIALHQVLPNTAPTRFLDQTQLKRLAQNSTPQEIQLYYQILLEGSKNIVHLADQKLAAEMIFLRALAFVPKTVDLSQAQMQTNIPQNKITQNEAVQSDANQNQTIQNEVSPNQAPQAHSPLEALIQQRAQLIKKSNREVSAPASKLHVETTIPVHAESKSQSLPDYQWQFREQNPEELTRHEQTPEQRFSQKIIQRANLEDSWGAELETAAISGLLKQVALNSFVEKQADFYRLHLRSHCQMLLNQIDAPKLLSKALTQLHQRNIAVEIVIDDEAQQKTPFEWRQKEAQAAMNRAVCEIEQDQNVDLICQFFQTGVDKKTILPV